MQQETTIGRFVHKTEHFAPHITGLETAPQKRLFAANVLCVKLQIGQAFFRWHYAAPAETVFTSSHCRIVSGL